MASTDIDESLREHSKLLLRKLKEKQSRLQSMVNQFTDERDKNAEDQSSLSREGRADTCPRTVPNDSVQMLVTRSTGKEGRSRLNRQRTKSQEEKVAISSIKSANASEENKENLVETYSSKHLRSKDVDIKSKYEYPSRETNESFSNESIRMNLMKESEIEDGLDSETSHKGLVTPNTIRRRRIIDRNVKVSGPGSKGLDESELMRECEEEFPRLNYSYSNVEDTDLKYLQERFGSATDPHCMEDEIPVRDGAPETSERYSENLDNPGNSRKFAKFIRETNKPKSILLSTGARANKNASASSSRVSFRSPTRDGSTVDVSFPMDASSRQKQKMMGYDWIAALIENDPNAVNQSETFFEELKEFRKVNLQECVNNMYMEGPQELWEHPEREPSPVQRALEETSTRVQHPLSEVKPYVVNDRLFTEPVKRSLFADYDYDEAYRNREDAKEGTYEEPRFVRVSIPRSTLMSPHRVKPHRRNSFDASDSMALSDHCLKGWSASQPPSMPAASSISLRGSTTGVNPTHKTTLSDAETLAANHPYEWDPAEQSISRPLPRPMYRPESSYMNGSWPHSMGTNTGSNPSVGSNPSFRDASNGLQNATDELLNSTYSLMYEMQRLKHERSDNPLRV